MPRPRIHVINPNSNEAVTRGIDDAIAAQRASQGDEEDGPDRSRLALQSATEQA